MTNSISARLRALSYHIDETGLADEVDAKSCTEAADHIDAQAAKIEEQAERIEELEAACEVVSNEFEGELWQSCRRLLQETYFDFSGTRGDGIQAADFESHMKETLSEFDRLQVKSDTQDAKIKELVEALDQALPHVNTAREAAERAASERQDTPALDAVATARAALAAAKGTA